MRWEDVPATVDDWFAKTAAVATLLRPLVSDVITASHVGYYCDPYSGRVGVFAPLASASDAARVKQAVSRAGAGPLFLSHQALAAPYGSWVKVAHSATLHRAGELANFFPGQYPGGIPNAPSPLAAMLTSGLLGAGLGWGAGKLIGSRLPRGYGDNLARTGALLGGAVGAAPGALWGATNTLAGKGFNDPSLLNHPAGAEPETYPVAADGANASQLPESSHTPGLLHDLQEAAHNAPLHRLKLGSAYLAAVEKVASTFGTPDLREAHPADVNIDHLGRVLWDTGASPGLAATTMGGMYAAQQLPDARSRPGWVTGNQLGQLAANAAGDYATGYLVGAAINAAVGTPYRASTLGAGTAVLGVLGAVVPRLLGR